MYKLFYNLKIVTVILLLSSSTSLLEAQKVIDTINVLISNKNLIQNNFLGFGAEWDPQFWAPYNIKLGVTGNDWDIVEGRIKWMRLPFVRMMMEIKWLTNGDSIFNWNSTQMQSVYKHLDLCERNGIDVILTDWGIEEAYDKVPGFTGNDDPGYAEAIGQYLDYLINTKGYDCIKYFVFVNEPNYEGGGWDKWKNGLLNVVKAIKKRNLKLKIVGPDVSGNGYAWYLRSLKELKSVFDIWEMHTYYYHKQVINSSYKDSVKKYWSLAKSNDENSNNKRFIIGEMGVKDGLRGAYYNDSSETFWYGMNIVNMAFDAIKSGTSAVSAWMLEDASEQNFTNGMWRDKSENFKIKPWFYFWALLTRNFPKGSNVFLPSAVNSDSLVFLASNMNNQWAAFFINKTNEKKYININFSDLESQTEFYVYSLEKNMINIDANQFLIPSQTILLDKNSGKSILIAPNSFLVITSF